MHLARRCPRRLHDPPENLEDTSFPPPPSPPSCSSAFDTGPALMLLQQSRDRRQLDCRRWRLPVTASIVMIKGAYTQYTVTRCCLTALLPITDARCPQLPAATILPSFNQAAFRNIQYSVKHSLRFQVMPRASFKFTDTTRRAWRYYDCKERSAVLRHGVGCSGIWFRIPSHQHKWRLKHWHHPV
jgi:hypothetical protein